LVTIGLLAFAFPACSSYDVEVYLRMPLRRWPIWLLATSLPLGLVGLSLVYYPLLLKSGTLDPYADTIVIPIAENFMLAVMSAPLIGVVTWAALRNYFGGSALFCWDTKRPTRSWVVSILSGVAIAAIVHDTVVGFWWPAPLYELLWIPYSFLCMIWVLVLVPLYDLGAGIKSRRAVEC
jgi:hypothetical protein